MISVTNGFVKKELIPQQRTGTGAANDGGSMTEKLAGMGLIAGCVLFMIAAFTPLTFRVITADIPQRVALIQNERMGWVLLNILFGTGSVLAAVGLALFTLHVQSLQDNP